MTAKASPPRPLQLITSIVLDSRKQPSPITAKVSLGRMKRYTTISLFSGAMGLDIGLEKTGRFDVLTRVESQLAGANAKLQFPRASLPECLREDFNEEGLGLVRYSHVRFL